MRFRPAPSFALCAIAASLATHAAEQVDAANVLVITAARVSQPADEVIGDITVIRRAELEQYSGQSLAEVLPAQAGVQISSNGGPGKSGSVFIRGANGNHTLVLIDGVRYSSATTGTAALQHLAADQIERVEILRGPAASLYGADAIGGVIQVFTRRGSEGLLPSMQIGIGNQGNKTLDLGLRGGSERSQFNLALAHSETDGVSAITPDSSYGYNPDRDGYTITSLSGSYSYQASAGLSVGAQLLLADTDSQFDSESAYDNHDKGTQGAGSAWLSAQINPLWHTRVQAGSSVDLSTSIYSYGEDVFNTRQRQLGWQNDLALAGGTVSLSVESLRQMVSGSSAYPVTSRRIDSALAGYLGKLGPLNLQANVRYDDNSQFGDFTSALAGLGWQFSPEWEVGATAASGFRAPTFNDLYYPESWGYAGNPEVKPEESYSREVFVRYSQRRLSARLTAYHNEVSDLIDWAYNDATGLTSPTNVSRATLNGATVLLDWQGEQLEAGGSLDWLDATDSSGGSNDGHKLARRASRAATAYTGVQLGRLRARIEVQAQGGRYNNASNTTRLAGYALTNLSASWQFSRDWTVHARLNNLFDRDYVLVSGYGTLGRNGLLSLQWQPQ